MIYKQFKLLIIICLISYLTTTHVAFGNNDTQQHYHQLSQKIEKYNQLYYQGNPAISDREFDLLLKELKDIERLHPEWIDEHSPTKHVGSEVLNEEKFDHLSPMLSIDSVQTIQDLIYFDSQIKSSKNDSIEYYVEDKIDGVAISLQYENGQLIHALTRGDGHKGTDITNLIQNLPTIPHQLIGNFPGLIEIRGELVISKEKFIQINQNRLKHGEQPFANARNLAAGSLHLKDKTIFNKRGLEMIAYSIGYQSNIPVQTQAELINFLSSLGFRTNKGQFYSSMEDVTQQIDQRNNKRKTLLFETDGLVIKFNSLAKQHSLGTTSKHVKGMIAYKPQGRRELSTINDIIWQVGRTGRITPVALITSVNIDGSKINRVSLHNAEEIKKLNIHIGDEVLIEKAGRVIPKIVRVTKHHHPDHPDQQPADLNNCPVCLLPLKGKNNSAGYYCRNPQCPGILKKQIEYFADHQRMNIKYLTAQLINQLVNQKNISGLTDIYQLTADMLEQSGLSTEESQTLLRSIEQSKNLPFNRQLTALGIPHIGQHKAKLISKYFDTVEKLTLASENDLINIPGIGQTAAESIMRFFNNDSNREWINIFENVQ